MNGLLDTLIEKNDNQKNALLQLLEVLKEEREVLKKDEPALLPELLKRLQSVSGKAILAESEREKAALKLAEALDCDPVVSEICKALEPEGSSRLKNSARELLSAVVSIKELNFILSRQAEEHRFLSEMILQRLQNAASNGKTSSGMDHRA